MSKPVIVSGIQPTGNLHIGNYLGAVKNFVALQNSGKYEMYIFIADLHSLTGKKPDKKLREMVQNTAAEYIAAGIDPKKTTIFAQSDVVGHTELGWIFNCVTPMGELERMTQYKDKTQQLQQTSAGLFAYPVLQAADILLYKANKVPVGQDQVQHVELTRNIARWFNNKYGEFFTEPEHMLTTVPKVMSLLEPEKKMSKSLGEGHVVELREEPDEIENKIKRAVTATSGGGEAPGVKNLLGLIKEFGDQKVYEDFVQAERDGSIRYGALKSSLTLALSEYFAAFREKRAKLLKNPKKIEKLLAAGAKKAQKVANKNMAEIKKLVGLK